MKAAGVKIMLNQRGSIINVALLIFVLLVLIGVGLSRMSTTDIKIANNEKANVTAFYEADAGLDAMAGLVEENIACSTGFDNTSAQANGDVILEGEIRVTAANLNFWTNTSAGIPTAGNRIAYYPPVEDTTGIPHTNLTAGGNVRFSPGSAIQMSAGYEGLGKGSAGGGANVIYDVYAERIGKDNSSALAKIQWVHILGLAGDCNY